MEHAKKMVLVDPRVLSEMQQANTMNITQPESGVVDMTLQGLQGELAKIMNSSSLPLDEKTKLYGNYLQQFLTMKKKQTDVYNRPSQVSLSQVADSPPSKPETDSFEAEIIQSVPKTMQRHARLLVERVKQDPRLGWNARGELLLEGQAVPHSNMVDLINDMVRKRKNFNPLGWQDFARYLYESNVPRDLVRNPDRLAYMQQAFSSPPSGASPGRGLLPMSTIDSAIQNLSSPGMTARRGRGRSLPRGAATTPSVGQRGRGRGRRRTSHSPWLTL